MPKLTEEQRAERKSYIGASDIGAIAGLNPFKDSFDVLNEKLGFDREGGDNEAAEWGHRLEPLIRAHYTHETASEVIPCGTVRHPVETWAGCTLDSKIVGTRRGLEIKLVGPRMVFDWDPTTEDGIPHYVRAQAAWQSWVVDLEAIDVAALLGGVTFKIWRVMRDLELEARLIEMGRRFHVDHILEGKAPVLTAGEGVRAYLEGRYPPPPAPVIVDADETIAVLVSARDVFKQARDAAESSYRRTTAEAIAWLGERNATDVKGADWEFRYRVRKDGTRQPWFKRKGDK